MIVDYTSRSVALFKVQAPGRTKLILKRPFCCAKIDLRIVYTSDLKTVVVANAPASEVKPRTL